MKIIIIFLCCFLASLAVGTLIYQKLYKFNFLDRLIAAVIPTSLVVLCALHTREILRAVLIDWSGNRLAPALSMLYGYKLYYPSDSGLVNGEMYGPIKALIYLPATLANSPTTTVILAAIINISFFFLPIMWLCLGKHWGNFQATIISAGVFILFGFFAHQSKVLYEAAFTVHADSPALGLSAISCAILYYRQQKDRFLPLILSAIFAVLAVWTKQVTLPILVSLPLYILLADGRKCFQRYIICLTVAGLTISTILILVFDFQPLLFNLFTIASNQPWWEPNKIKRLLSVSQELMNETLLPGLLIAFYISYQFLFNSDSLTKFNWRDRFKQNQWIMFLIVSILMIPTSLLGRVKIGGAENALSYTVYFLFVAASLILIELGTKFYDNRLQKTERTTKLAIVLLIIALTTNNLFPAVFRLVERAEQIKTNNHQVAYEYAKKHPGEVYFPWHILSTLMAEQKMYHFEDAVANRELAGFKVSKQHFLQHIPQDMKFVAHYGQPNWLKGNADYVLKKYLPEFSKKVQIDSLPGWTVYAKE
ncbi:MAG: hypothetical protein ACFCAD_14510 [Pleurocapsa sp.]